MLNSAVTIPSQRIRGYVDSLRRDHPDADPEDGRVDVMVSRAVSRFAQLGYVVRLGRGEHTQRDDVVTFRGHRVTVSGEEFWTSADGELDGPERRRTWRIEPGAYRLLRPRH